MAVRNCRRRGDGFAHPHEEQDPTEDREGAQVRRDGVEGADDEGQPGDRETGAGDRSGQPAQLGQGATVDPDQDGGNEDDDDDDVEQVHRREG